MSAKNRPTSKPMSQQFAENYDRIFKKKEAPLKGRSELGVSPSTEVIDIDTHDKEHWEGFMAAEKEDE
jgi:hypothetical protein